jgi:hypothetical protein
MTELGEIWGKRERETFITELVEGRKRKEKSYEKQRRRP